MGFLLLIVMLLPLLARSDFVDGVAAQAAAQEACKAETGVRGMIRCLADNLDNMSDDFSIREDLQKIMRKMPSTSTDYALAWSVGDTGHAIKVGYMTQAIWDQVYAIPMRLPRYTDRPKLLLHGYKSSRSLILFLTNAVEAVPYKDTFMPEAGGDHTKRVYEMHGSVVTPSGLSLHCEDVDKDKEISSIRGQTGLAVILSADRWCPSHLTKDFDIFVGSLKTERMTVGGLHQEVERLTNGFLHRDGKTIRVGKPHFPAPVFR